MVVKFDDVSDSELASVVKKIAVLGSVMDEKDDSVTLRVENVSEWMRPVVCDVVTEWSDMFTIRTDDVMPVTLSMGREVKETWAVEENRVRESDPLVTEQREYERVGKGDDMEQSRRMRESLVRARNECRVLRVEGRVNEIFVNDVDLRISTNISFVPPPPACAAIGVGRVGTKIENSCPERVTSLRNTNPVWSLMLARFPGNRAEPAQEMVAQEKSGNPQAVWLCIESPPT